jgi:leucyl aminopeptidase (aminopeptidase T)
MIKKYIEQALNICLTMRDNDSVLIISDKETSPLGKKFLDAAKEISPNGKHYYFEMEDFGERLPDNPVTFPDKLASIMETIDISIYAAQGKTGELASFRIPMLETVTRSKRIKHGHMPGLNEQILINGFGENYGEVVDLTNRVLEEVKTAKTARVTTKLGTDLRIVFNPAYKWIPSHAIIQPGSYGNIPSGEVFTCVETCEGKVVIDGEVGDYLCEKYGILKDNPLTVEIKDGRASCIRNRNQELIRDLEKYLTMDENANRVGEFAIGTNINLKEFIGNLLLDEKFPGVHIAFGSGYPDKTGASWNGKAHLDCIITEPTVIIDQREIMREGNFLV